jgi:hypothetical protein
MTKIIFKNVSNIETLCLHRGFSTESPSRVLMECEGVMELLREHVWRTVMESKQSQFWNAVAVAGFTVLAGILMGYVALSIVLPG